MLVCDLDGTLLNGSGIMTAATVAALGQAIDAGMEIVFATGRRHSFAWRVLETLGLDRDTVLISSNGAIISTLSGDRMRRITMPIPTALLLCQHVAAFRSALVFTFDRTGPGALAVEDVDELHRRIPRWVDSNVEEIESFMPLERAFDSGDEPIQAMICGTIAEMQQATAVLDSGGREAARLGRHLSIHRTQYVSRDLSIVDLMPEGCSKGNALAWLAARRGISAAEIACIGDNMNDADMLAFAGQAFLMQNAPVELLEQAARSGWAVIGSNEEDGAAEAILRMLEKAQRPLTV